MIPYRIKFKIEIELQLNKASIHLSIRIWSQNVQRNVHNKPGVFQKFLSRFLLGFYPVMTTLSVRPYLEAEVVRSNAYKRSINRRISQFRYTNRSLTFVNGDPPTAKVLPSERCQWNYLWLGFFHQKPISPLKWVSLGIWRIHYIIICYQ
jgi:hypothetical protein